jgi:hypothetical protein
MSELVLTPEQEAEAQRLAEIIGRKAQEEALRMARLLVSKPDAELLGRTEYELRDRAHGLAAGALETALRERKKGGTTGRAGPARTAARRRGSSTTGPKGS